MKAKNNERAGQDTGLSRMAATAGHDGGGERKLKGEERDLRARKAFENNRTLLLSQKRPIYSRAYSRVYNE